MLAGLLLTIALAIVLSTTSVGDRFSSYVGAAVNSRSLLAPLQGESALVPLAVLLVFLVGQVLLIGSAFVAESAFPYRCRKLSRRRLWQHAIMPDWFRRNKSAARRQRSN